ncbi:MAG: D-alanyl-D-alanine carboxypeptidase/D-alanyl-D-alanine-endopeptidase [Candidatus Cloacimonadota bacterium]|nr:MAG: D-alanyl-D-alanine carboxypeptidase/D-alanyl-D-alanine-endopeptidase [Candidatus Cloacimonadota bacterium]PIE77913.1 MAG: D-alanyl-D-alanine carboxypeptidase/D-alanyl-D-alanine-endopeptidase [Candidatus Delongbacteria bacterium]
MVLVKLKNYSINTKVKYSMFKFKIIIIILISLCFPSVSKNSNKTLSYSGSKSLENLIKDNNYGIWSISVFDLSSNKEIYSYNKDLHLIPASNQKLITTATALEFLGKDFRYINEVKYSGKISDSTLNGNLYIYSKGDPTIGKDYFRSREKGFAAFDKLTLFLRDSIGIKSINGDIILPNKLPVKSRFGTGWELDDLSNYYAAPITNYSFNENLIKVFIDKEKIKTDPEYGFIFNKIVDEDSSCKLYRVANSNEVDIISNFKSRYRKYLTVPNPPLLFKKLLIERMEEGGINVSKEKITKSDKRKLIYRFYSNSLDSLLKKCNSESNNFFAEQIFRTTANEYRVSLDSLFEITHKNSFYTNIEDSKTFKEIISSIFGLDIKPADGSGLSRYNQLSSSEITSILKFMYKSKNFEPFLSTLAKPGYKGTMESKFLSSETSEMVFGKTGSMTNVYSFSGYLITNSGKTIAFSFINNNHQVSKRAIIGLIMEYIQRLIIFF